MSPLSRPITPPRSISGPNTWRAGRSRSFATGARTSWKSDLNNMLSRQDQNSFGFARRLPVSWSAHSWQASIVAGGSGPGLFDAPGLDFSPVAGNSGAVDGARGAEFDADFP